MDTYYVYGIPLYYYTILLCTTNEVGTGKGRRCELDNSHHWSNCKN